MMVRDFIRKQQQQAIEEQQSIKKEAQV